MNDKYYDTLVKEMLESRNGCGAYVFWFVMIIIFSFI